MNSARYTLRALLILSVLLPMAPLCAQTPAGREFVVVLPSLMEFAEMNRDIASFMIEVSCSRRTNISLRWAGGQPILNTQAEAGTRAVFMRPMFSLWQIMQSPLSFDAEKPNKRAFVITADQPVTVQALFDTNYRAENFQVFPVESYDTSYTLVNYAGYAASGDRTGFIVMASQDNTEIRITPTQQTWAAHIPGVEYTVRLNRHEVYQVVSTHKSSGPESDLTSTSIRSNKPVGVLSFSAGSCVPTHGRPGPPRQPPGSGDMIEYEYSTKLMLEHLPPHRMAGTTFYTLPFVRKVPNVPTRVNRYAREPGKIQWRVDTSMLRFVSLEFGTTFDTNGVRIKAGSGADSTFARGSWIDIPFTGPMKVTASKPVVGMQFMYSGREGLQYDTIVDLGGSQDSVQIAYGNPSMVYIPPVAQYAPNLQFAVPNVKERPAPGVLRGLSIFWRHYLIITAPVAAASKVKLNGAPVNFAYPHSDGQYTSAYVRAFPGQRQLIESPEPITAMSYGLTWEDSYGTTAGVSVRSVARATPDTLRFFSCEGEKDTSITIANVGNADFTLDSIRVSGVSATVTYPTPLPRTFVGSSSDRIIFRFSTPQPGVYTGSIRLYSDANEGAVLVVPFVITRDSAQLAFPAAIDFGVLKASETQRDTTVIFTNNGARPVVLRSLTFAGGGYQLIGATLPDTIAPGASDTIRVRFTPTADGLREATMNVVGEPCLRGVAIPVRGFKGNGANALVQRLLLYEGYLCAAPAYVDSVILLRSIGDEPITIGTATIDGMHKTEFALIDALDGRTVVPGDTLRMTVRYTPGGYGERRAVLKLTTNAKNAAQIDIDLIARKDTVTLVPTVDTVRFGRALSCDDTLEASVSVRNTGTVADTITAADLGGVGAYAIGTALPIVLNPLTTQEIRIRFAPSTDGQFPARLRLLGSPCNVEATVWLSGERASPSLAATPVAFDTVYSCQDAPVRAVIVTNNGAVPDTILGASDGSGIFVVQGATYPRVIAPGVSDTFLVTFTPPNPGAYAGAIRFFWGPCNRETDVAAAGTWVAPVIAFDSLDLDFGTVDVTGSASRTVIVRNTGLVLRRVIELVPSVPEVTVLSPALPATILPGEQLSVELEYAPSVKGVLAAQLRIRFADPCGSDTLVMLAGQAIGDEIIRTSFTVSAPDTAAQVDTQIEIPILVSGWANVVEAAPSAMRVELSYNYTLLAPLGVGSPISGMGARIVSDDIDGELRRLVVMIEGSAFPSDGELARIRFAVLLGDTDRTRLRIDSVSITTPPNRLVAAARRDGAFQTLGICRTGGDRFVRLGGIRLKSVRPNPFRDQVAVEYEIDRRESVKVRLFDSFGTLVRTLASGEMAAGTHLLRVDAAELPSGMYVCEIDNGRERVRTSLLLAR